MQQKGREKTGLAAAEAVSEVNLRLSPLFVSWNSCEIYCYIYVVYKLSSSVGTLEVYEIILRPLLLLLLVGNSSRCTVTETDIATINLF